MISESSDKDNREFEKPLQLLFGPLSDRLDFVIKLRAVMTIIETVLLPRARRIRSVNSKAGQ